MEDENNEAVHNRISKRLLRFRYALVCFAYDMGLSPQEIAEIFRTTRQNINDILNHDGT